MMLHRDIKAAQREFGLKAYDLVVNGDLSGAQRVANEKRPKIDNWRELIKAKESEIARLNEEASMAGEKVPANTSYDEDPNGDVVI